VGDIRDVLDIIRNNQALLAANSPWTSDWRGAEDLNGCQFWISYTGTATVNVTVEVSAVPPTQARHLTRTDWSKVYTVKAGAANAEGFVDPPDPPMDRPFGSYRVIVATDANITALRVGICKHGLG